MKLETLTMLANDLLKINNVINTCLIHLHIILYYSFSLNIYEYLQYHQHQYSQNQPKTHTHIYLFLLASNYDLKNYLKYFLMFGYACNLKSFALN